MTKKEKSKKVITMVIAMVLFIFGIVGIDAMQWHTQEKTATFSVAGYSFELLDGFTQHGLYAPGDVVSHNVAVKSTGSGSIYVRIKAVFESSEIEDVCTLDLNTADYVYHDGYYYLTAPLTSGATSPSLFTTITIASDATLPDDFSPNMIVYAEAINIGRYKNYEDAWGIVVEQEETEVTNPTEEMPVDDNTELSE